MRKRLPGRWLPDGTHLTARELQVSRLLAIGCCNKQVAGELNISVKTVEKHRQALYRKFGVNHLIPLVRAVLIHGIFDFEEWIAASDPGWTYRKNEIAA